MKSLRRSYDKKRSTIRWMKQTQLQLKLSPAKTKAIQTWTCVRLLLQWGTHSGVSAESASRGIEDRTALFFRLCRARGESSLSVERLHVDLQLSRSTWHCLPAFSFSYLFWTALRDFLDMTKRPLSVSPSNNWVEIFCFSPLALLCPVDGSFIHHCLYFFYKFSQFRAAIEVAEQPPNKRRRNSSFFVIDESSRHPFDACRTCCSRKRNRRPFSASPSNSVDCVTHAIRSIVAPFKSHGTVNSRKRRHGEWTCSTKIFPHIRNSESRFASTCLPRSRFLCDRRPTSASPKLEICATRATNKVHIDEQPVGESKKRSLTSFKVNFQGKLALQIFSRHA